MYHAFGPQCSFHNFLHKINEFWKEYVFVMLTFTGSYASMVTKHRYINERLHEEIPLLVIDIRHSLHLYHHIQHIFPKLLSHEKIPLHLCFKKIFNPEDKSLHLQPVLRNAAPLGDRHFEQLRSLLAEDTLEKHLRVTTS
jgi:hypothetical protein